MNLFELDYSYSRGRGTELFSSRGRGTERP